MLRPTSWVGLSALWFVVVRTPGAAPQAGVGRAVGAKARRATSDEELPWFGNGRAVGAKNEVVMKRGRARGASRRLGGPWGFFGGGLDCGWALGSDFWGGAGASSRLLLSVVSRRSSTRDSTTRTTRRLS